MKQLVIWILALLLLVHILSAGILVGGSENRETIGPGSTPAKSSIASSDDTEKPEIDLPAEQSAPERPQDSEEQVQTSDVPETSEETSGSSIIIDINGDILLPEVP